MHVCVRAFVREKGGGEKGRDRSAEKACPPPESISAYPKGSRLGFSAVPSEGISTLGKRQAAGPRFRFIHREANITSKGKEGERERERETDRQTERKKKHGGESYEMRGTRGTSGATALC